MSISFRNFDNKIISYSEQSFKDVDYLKRKSLIKAIFYYIDEV